MKKFWSVLSYVSPRIRALAFHSICSLERREICDTLDSVICVFLSSQLFIALLIRML